jgi:hypothetical protein
MKFPIRWLTYKQRVREDVKAALAEDNAEEFFDGSFLEKIATSTKQQEDWVLKLLTLQVATIGFLIVGFVAPDAQISLLGLELKNLPGIREVLLVFSSTTAVAISSELIDGDGSRLGGRDDEESPSTGGCPPEPHSGISHGVENALWCRTIAPGARSIISGYQRLGGTSRLWRAA